MTYRVDVCEHPDWTGGTICNGRIEFRNTQDATLFYLRWSDK